MKRDFSLLNDIKLHGNINKVEAIGSQNKTWLPEADKDSRTNLYLIEKDNKMR